MLIFLWFSKNTRSISCSSITFDWPNNLFKILCSSPSTVRLSKEYFLNLIVVIVINITPASTGIACDGVSL